MSCLQTWNLLDERCVFLCLFADPTYIIVQRVVFRFKDLRRNEGSKPDEDMMPVVKSEEENIKTEPEEDLTIKVEEDLPELLPAM